MLSLARKLYQCNDAMYKISGTSTMLSGILNTFMALKLVQYSAYDLSYVLVMAAQG